MAIATMKTTERKKEDDNDDIDDKDDDTADEDYDNYDQEFKTRLRFGLLPLNHGCDNKYVCDHDYEYDPVNDPRFRLKATKKTIHNPRVSSRLRPRLRSTLTTMITAIIKNVNNLI